MRKSVREDENEKFPLEKFFWFDYRFVIITSLALKIHLSLANKQS